MYGRASLYLTVVDIEARDFEPPAHAEGCPDCGVSFGNVPIDGFEQSCEGAFHVFQQVVDDVVMADFNAFLIGKRHRALSGLGVEAYDNRLGCEAEHDIALRNRAACNVDDVDPGLLGVQAVERALDRFDGALHIGLDDEVERLDLARGDAGVDVFKGGACRSLPL